VDVQKRERREGDEQERRLCPTWSFWPETFSMNVVFPVPVMPKTAMRISPFGEFGGLFPPKPV
jgi:hypothetical protein